MDGTCQAAACGDGFVQSGVEGCDDGNADNTDACPDGVGGTCQAAACGDGFVQDGVEGCDDGNADNTDACPDGVDGTCQAAACGDGFVQSGVEGCDDGNADNTDACPDGVDGTCQAAACGDGFVQSGVEGCDDGNGDNTDTCPDGAGGTCQAATCGDGFTQTGVETCDDGFEDACGTCNADCTAAGAGSTCGDGETCPETEARDDGFEDACGTCNADCSGDGAGSTCGDGELCVETEECDDGGTDRGDGCDNLCVDEGVLIAEGSGTRSGAVVGELRQVNLVTGVETLIGAVGVPVAGMAVDPLDGSLWAVDAATANSLLTIDKTTGAATTVVALTGAPGKVNDLAFLPDGRLLGFVEAAGQIFEIDRDTGAVTALASSVTPTSGCGGAGLAAVGGDEVVVSNCLPAAGGILVASVDVGTGVSTALPTLGAGGSGCERWARLADVNGRFIGILSVACGPGGPYLLVEFDPFTGAVALIKQLESPAPQGISAP